MSRLVVYPERVLPEGDAPQCVHDTADAGVIARALAAQGVRFERWAASVEDADPLIAYGPQVEALRAQGYGTIDVVRVAPDANDPRWLEQASAMREKFRDEHTHDENEVRFFARGAGVFYLRLAEHVHCVRCEAGDLLSVPAGTRHWFDMGAVPDFVAIRFFESATGWVGNFSGDPIARRFPSFDELT
jgi:1,2-dihydroxy-3-keto-5-methylthiopentene dioxygenase